MPGNKYKTILFDLDGTLVNYDAAQKCAAAKAIEQLGKSLSPELEQKVLELVSGNAVQDIEACRPGWMPADSAYMQNIFTEAGVNLPSGLFLSNYFEAMSQHGEALPGVIDLLISLKKDHTIGIVSNGLGPVQRKRLAKAELMEYLDLLVVSCEAGYAKPDPAILQFAMKLAESTPENTLFVGDSAGSDMGVAEAAGVDFVFIQPDGDFSAPGPRVLELRKIADLKNFLKDICS
ncbi:MAG: HAD family hydrolase [Candidatus Aegiribacteria sp.]|nr:HAD family hydrolase [Candidatus Aegiribacteria sp.]